MNLFGRKRHQARQEAHTERCAEMFQLGLSAGRVAFENCTDPPVKPEDDGTTAAAFLIGVHGGYEAARWQFEEECDVTLQALGKSVVREAEEITRAAA